MNPGEKIKAALARELDGTVAEESLKRRVLLRLDKAAAQPAHRTRALPGLRRGRLWRYGAPILLPAAVFAALALMPGVFGADAEPPAANVAKVPSFVPAGYAMTEIEAVRQRGAEPELVLRYEDAAGTDVLELIQRRSKEAEETAKAWERAGYERIELSGRTAWMKRLTADTLELVWQDERTRYTLSGKVDESDARKMAGSITLRIKEDQKP
ncbi:DUF4367 domain-containing protein [Cohnella sp. 56]|uniref:DUF4367 domain-containing protein n=1 Tax=Cohnella sp. 56 TaxID=3113722 RepID=UPI0030E8B621